MPSSLDQAEPTPAKRPGRRRSPAKRAAILAAARAEFGALGYRDAAMDAIAARAGLSKRTLYNHFPSKELLFRELVLALIGEISRTVRIEYDAAAPLRSQLERYARRSIALMRDSGALQLFRAVLAEHIRNPLLVEQDLPAYWKAEYGFADWVKAACADGRLTVPNARRAGHIFGSLMRGIIIWPVVLGRDSFAGTRPTAAIGEAIDMFLAYYATGRAEPAAK